MKLLMKWAQFINNYQKSTLGGPMMKQFVLQSCFLLRRNTNIMTDKGINLFDECAVRCVHLLSQEECNSSSQGDSKMNASSDIANSHRMQTEINERSTIAKIRI